MRRRRERGWIGSDRAGLGTLGVDGRGEGGGV